MQLHCSELQQFRSRFCDQEVAIDTNIPVNYGYSPNKPYDYCMNTRSKQARSLLRSNSQTREISALSGYLNEPREPEPLRVHDIHLR
ncbi:MAG: hypothetical protein F6K28_58030 [Microcoleus sp. SIO2G3]|nr:hypothetical protein [Microcoleus sp. SIO2G3]